MRVFVYYNLRRKLWSVKALNGPDKGRVVGHHDYVEVYSPFFKVSEAGRQRVIREGRKNVHAGVVGVLRTIEPGTIPQPPSHCPAERVTYNPRRFSTFVRVADESPVKHAVFATMRVGDGLPPTVTAWGAE